MRPDRLTSSQGQAGISATADVSFHAKSGFSRPLALPCVASATDRQSAALVMLARITHQEGPLAAA